MSYPILTEDQYNRLIHDWNKLRHWQRVVRSEACKAHGHSPVVTQNGNRCIICLKFLSSDVE